MGRLVPESRRALALRITTIDRSIGMFAFIPIGQTLIASMGWVQAILTLSILAALGIFLACPLAGDPNEGAPAAQKQSLSEHIVEARGHSGFWLLTIGFFLCGFHVTLIAVHLPSFLSDQGMTAAFAAIALAVIGLANIGSSIFAGICGDQFRTIYSLRLLYLPGDRHDRFPIDTDHGNDGAYLRRPHWPFAAWHRADYQRLSTPNPQRAVTFDAVQVRILPPPARCVSRFVARQIRFRPNGLL